VKRVEVRCAELSASRAELEQSLGRATEEVHALAQRGLALAPALLETLRELEADRERLDARLRDAANARLAMQREQDWMQPNHLSVHCVRHNLR